MLKYIDRVRYNNGERDLRVVSDPFDFGGFIHKPESHGKSPSSRCGVSWKSRRNFLGPTNIQSWWKIRLLDRILDVVEPYRTLKVKAHCSINYYN